MSNYITTPISGAISSRISALTSKVINELCHKDKYTIQEMMNLLETDPVAKICVEMKAQRATVSMGEYSHKNKEIQEFIRSNISNMEGTLNDVVGRMCSSMPLGFAVGEIVFKNKALPFAKTKFSWVLDRINVLDPRHISFRGTEGSVTEIRYSDGSKEVMIPYDKVIHIVNGLTTSFNEGLLYGSPEMKRAYPFIRLKQLIFAEMGVSAKTLATGILVGKTDSERRVTMYGRDRKPITDAGGNAVTVSAVESLAHQLSGLENNSQIVTDKLNDIMALQVPAGEQFWNLALTLVNAQIMRAFGVPELAFSEGSASFTSGMATLSQKQITLLDSSIEAVVTRLKDVLIEKVIRPLIIWNFGAQKDYGEFSVETVNDPQSDSLIIGNLISAISMQILSASDPDVINALRERLHLPLVSREQIAMQAPPPEEAPPEEDPATAQAPNQQYP